MTQPSTPRKLGLSDALQAYETCGFDTAAIRQWCIPELDAEMLVEATLRQRPKRILEVGTYVGVSTMLLALATDADATIVTIDPNLPLGIEMGSMQSDLGSLDGAARTHDVARAAARQLGVDQRIHFIEGGFAIGDTFSSSRQDPAAQVAVVGPSTCAAFGPFDLVFIDGLHYAAAVEADLRLAATALAPGGLILMHDCIGMWGTNVRAGIFRFLAAHPEFRVVHPTFGELYRSIGTVFRAGERPELMEKLRASEPQAHVIQAAVDALVSSAIHRLRPEFVVELAAGRPVVTPVMEAAGIPAISASVEVPSEVDRQVVEARLREVDAAWNAATPHKRMLMSVDLIDQLPEDALQALLEWLRERDGLALFSFTPPGEFGVAGTNSRSFPQLVQLLGEAGLAAATCSRLDADPVEFAFAMANPRRATTSFCANTVLVGRNVRIAEIATSLHPSLVKLEVAEAEAFEQETLLRLHYSRAFAWTFDELARIRDRLSEQEWTSEDLRRQIRERSGLEADLRMALGERDRADAQLRRQLAEQVAHSENLAREALQYRDVLTSRDWTEKDLRRQLAEQVARSEDLVRQVLDYKAALEIGDRQKTESPETISE